MNEWIATPVLRFHPRPFASTTHLHTPSTHKQTKSAVNQLLEFAGLFQTHHAKPSAADAGPTHAGQSKVCACRCVCVCWCVCICVCVFV